MRFRNNIKQVRFNCTAKKVFLSIKLEKATYGNKKKTKGNYCTELNNNNRKLASTKCGYLLMFYEGIAIKLDNFLVDSEF